MLHVALWEPQIPPNTGNIARLCAATGSRLHLIGRLGFRMDDRSLKRAGIDYWHAVDVVCHETFAEFERSLQQSPATIVGGLSPHIWCVDNPAERSYTRAEFRDSDCLLFGNESDGLPAELRERFADRLISIPMPTGKVRSLNLATAAGIVVYEALRQVRGW
jgi:tRNA (cytidine/uridine-2'-O-)-methyltransferase